MKKILALTLAATLSCCLFAVDIFKYAPVSENVKSCTKTEYAISSKFGNYFRTASSKFITTYDGAGRIVSSTELTAKDTVVNRILSVYDNFGNLTEQNAFDTENNVIWKNVYTYKNNLRTDETGYNANGELKEKTIYTYTEGKLSDETLYDSEGALVWKTIYTYTSDGLVSEIFQYDSDGILDTKSIYAYADGRITSITYVDRYTRTSTQDVFRYGTDNTLSEITTYDANKKITKRLLIKYDSAKNVARLSDYAIAEKFGTTVNELISQIEFNYEY